MSPSSRDVRCSGLVRLLVATLAVLVVTSTAVTASIAFERPGSGQTALDGPAPRPPERVAPANRTNETGSAGVLLDADWSAVGVPPPAAHAWRRTAGGPLFDRFRAADATPSGGLALAGRSDGRVGSDEYASERAWLVVTDADGAVRLNRTYAPVPSGRNRAADVAALNGSAMTTGDPENQSGGDGYLLLGSSGSTGVDTWLARLDADGDPLWTTNLTVGDRFTSLYPTAVVPTGDGSVVVGSIYGPDERRPFAARLDADGAVVWRREYAAGLRPVDVARTADGVVLACNDPIGADESTLLALDADGDVRWRHDAADATAAFGAVVPASTGGGVVAVGRGMTTAVAVDASGETRWRRTYDVPRANLTYPGGSGPFLTTVDAFATGDGVVVAGTVNVPGEMRLRPTLVRLDRGGADWRVDVRSSPVDVVRGATRSSDGGVAFVGESRTLDGAVDRLGAVAPDGTPAPADRNADGAYEDVNGDGATDVDDVRRLADLLGVDGLSGLAASSPRFPDRGARTVGDDRVATLATAFDVTGDGDVDVRDLRRLYASLPVRYEAAASDASLRDEPVVENGLTTPRADRTRYLTVLTTTVGRDRVDHSRLEDGASWLLNGTEFDRSFLVVYQSYPDSSSPDYAVVEATRSNDTLELTVTDASLGGTGDVTHETFLVRVHLDGHDPPERVRVREHRRDVCRQVSVGTSGPQDLDCDGRFADVNGDGRPGVGDVVALFARLDDDAVRDHPERFDFTGDGRVGVGDVVALFEDVSA